MKRLPLEVKYGLAIGLGTSAYILTEYVLGLHSYFIALGRYTGYFAMMIPIIGLYIAIKDKKEFELNQEITLGQALMVALKVNVISTTIITAFWALYFTVIHPDFITYGLEYTKTLLVQEGITGAQYHQKLAQYTASFQLKNQLVFIPIGTFTTGMVVGLIIGILHRSKPSIPTSGQ
ncbi:MAG: DUF4199 domain-containing protein [bacterium]|nr:DUF4199 domain-containing protein [bacterium]